MSLYECSGQSKKLKVYQWVPTVVMTPLVYLTFSNFYSLYSLGFGMWTLSKGILSTLGIAVCTGINGNLKYNSKTLCEQLWLCSDGMHIRVKQINGLKRRHPIHSLKPVTPEHLELMLRAEKRVPQQLKAFHEKFLPILVYSSVEKDRIMEAFYIERELVDSMDPQL